MIDPLLRFPAVMAAVGYGRSSLYKLVKDRKFPSPVRLAGGRAVAWRASDVQRWIEQQQRCNAQSLGGAQQ